MRSDGISRRALLALGAAGLLPRAHASPLGVREQIAQGAPVARSTWGGCDWELVRVAAGRFQMGSPPDEAGRGDGEWSPISVTITRPFYMARAPITQAQYQAVTGENPSVRRGELLPVDQITFRKALEFVEHLGSALGVRVTLPTEAQWEYACRAGTTTARYAELDRVAWYRGNSGERIHEIGKKAPNAWGLHDMLGNIFEPCIDSIESVPTLHGNDPRGAVYPDHGTARGGGWMSPADSCRAAARIHSNDMFGGMGIRPIVET